MVYAGFWKRFVALCLDFAILLLPIVALSWTFPYVLSFVLFVFYFPVFESSRMQATPGKYWMGLKVVQENGDAVGFFRALGRFIMKYASSAILMLGYLIQPFTARRQTFHDLVTASVVIEADGTAKADWISAWLDQMRSILRAGDAFKGDDHVVSDADGSTSGAFGNAHSTTEPGAPQPGAPQPSAHDIQSNAAIRAIEKLHELYKNGALTEEEFQNKKSELLSQV